MRHIDSAGIVPESNGTLPPVPQPALCSPEMGHLAVSSRQRSNIIESSNQKRLGKLQPIPNKPIPAASSNSPGSAIPKTSSQIVTQHRGNFQPVPSMLLIQQRKSHQSMPSAAASEESVNNAADYSQKSQERHNLNDDLLTDLGCTPSRLSSINMPEAPVHQRVQSMINNDGTLRLAGGSPSTGLESERVSNFGLTSNPEELKGLVSAKRSSQDGENGSQ